MSPTMPPVTLYVNSDTTDVRAKINALRNACAAFEDAYDGEDARTVAVQQKHRAEAAEEEVSYLRQQLAHAESLVPDPDGDADDDCDCEGDCAAIEPDTAARILWDVYLAGREHPLTVTSETYTKTPGDTYSFYDAGSQAAAEFPASAVLAIVRLSS